MQTVMVIVVVCALGALGGLVGRLLAGTSPSPPRANLRLGAVRLGVYKPLQGGTTKQVMASGVVVPALWSYLVTGVAAGLLVYGFSFGEQVVMIIGGTDQLTLSITQAALVLAGGIGGSDVVRRIIANKTSNEMVTTLQQLQAEEPRAASSLKLEHF